MIFHLGCGERKKPAGVNSDDYIVNVDSRDIPTADIVGCVSEIGWLVDIYGRPDTIAAEDVLEHLPRRSACAALGNWANWLVLGGLLHIRVPDLRHLAERFVAGHMNATQFERRVFGAQDYPENTHLCGWTRGSIVSAIEGCWLTVIRAETVNGNACVWARK